MIRHLGPAFLALIVICTTACAPGGGTPAGQKAGSGSRQSGVHADLAWFACVGGPSAFAPVEAPGAAPGVPFLPWALAIRPSGFVAVPAAGGSLFVAVNRRGLARLSVDRAKPLPAADSLRVGSLASHPGFPEKTVGGLFVIGGKPAVLLYRNLLFDEGAEGGSFLLTVDPATETVSEVKLPYMDTIAGGQAWETVYLSLGDGSASLAEVRRATPDGMEFRAFSFSPELGIVNELPLRIFTMMAAPRPVDRAPEALKPLFDESIALIDAGTGPAMDGGRAGKAGASDVPGRAAIEFDLRSDARGTESRYIRGDVNDLEEGNLSLVRVRMVAEAQRSGALIGDRLVVLGAGEDHAGAESRTFMLPPLPAGFVWSDFAFLSRDLAILSWEERTWPNVGRAGLCVFRMK